MQLNPDTPMTHLAQWGCIKFSGQDVTKFLQGQLTINPQHLKPNQLCLGAVCNPQGRCIALAFITTDTESVYFFQLAETIDETIAHLKKYSVFFKVAIDNISSRADIFCHSVLAEPNAPEELQGEPDSKVTAVSTINQFQFKLSLVEKSSLNEFIQLFGANQFYNDSQFLTKLGQNHIPWLTKGAQVMFLPHNLNLPELGAVDFKKGCFTGQEVIARMHYKGKLKSHMQLLEADTALKLSPGDKIYYQDKSVGEVICHISPSLNETYILALLKDSALDHKVFQSSPENSPILRLSTTQELE
ncbi:CAF17-like 4Fe-4S cluster assembly/insertion protein YgfZ [Aliikangiella sp. IMCC44632]